MEDILFRFLDVAEKDRIGEVRGFKKPPRVPFRSARETALLRANEIAGEQGREREI